MECYLCKKVIRDEQEKVSIGKGLVRHKKCNPGKPKDFKKEIKMTEQTPVVETPKVEEVKAPVVEQKKKRDRGRPKGSKNKPKVKKDEQKA